MSLDPFLNQSQDHGVPQLPQLKAGQWLFNRRYELLRFLGAGGMGVVWLARDHTGEFEVALKFLPGVLVLQEGEMKRLREEVRIGKELRHPRLVGTYGMEVEDGIAAIVMEFVPGQTLKEKLEAQERGFFEPEEIASWVQDIGAGLTYLHGDAKRIHRDLKPANIIVDATGRAKLMDFGISHRIKEGVSKHSKTGDGAASPSSSTLAYASPQQMGGKPSDKADDIYSLGATLYELLTGTPPFFRGGMEAVAIQIKTEPVTPILERRQELVAEGLNASTGKAVSGKVEQSVLACLSKEREKRPRAEKVVRSFSSSDFGDSNTATPGTQSPPRLKLLTTLAAICVITLVAVWTLKTKPKENTREEPGLIHPLANGKVEATAPAPLPTTTTFEQRVAAIEERFGELVPSFQPAKAAATLEERIWKINSAFGSIIDGPPKAWPADLTLEAHLLAVEEHVNSLAASKPAMPKALPVIFTPATAQKDAPFINSLGMKFVPVPIGAGPSKDQRVLFSIWETRSKDYAAFVKATGHDAGEEWKTYEYKGVPVGRGVGETVAESSHPVANVSQDDAVAFCVWLTKQDRATGLIGPQDEYRLPSDVEWSYAVGIGEKEDASASPKDKASKLTDVYPWGTGFPPPVGSENYSDSVAKAKFDFAGIDGYTDGYATTSPVGSFKADALGLYDLGGNLGEWTHSAWEPGSDSHVLRGGSWSGNTHTSLLSSFRVSFMTDAHGYSFGFRCVLAVSSN